MSNPQSRKFSDTHLSGVAVARLENAFLWTSAGLAFAVAGSERDEIPLETYEEISSRTTNSKGRDEDELVGRHGDKCRGVKSAGER